MDLVADGLQVALFGETTEQSLHAAVELVFAFKLERKRKSGGECNNAGKSEGYVTTCRTEDGGIECVVWIHFTVKNCREHNVSHVVSEK